MSEMLRVFLNVFESPIENLKVFRLRPDEFFKEPSRIHHGDAGFDLYCSEGLFIQPGVRKTIRTNTAVALPNGVWGQICGRSSTFHKLGLITNTGIIDHGYTGELYASVFNTDKESGVRINKGDRLIQLILFPLIVPMIDVVDKLPDRQRGDKGFGSTGK